jgi:hypothetical protein
MRLALCLVSVVAFVACSTPEKEDYKKDKPSEEAPAPPPTTPKAAVKKAHTPDELGTCHLNATGAVTSELTTKGGKDATNISYWYTAEEQKLMAGVDGFVIDCKGADFDFKVVPGGGKKDGMPFKPKKYDFAAGKGDGVLMIMFGKKPLDKPTGSIDVTAFDSHHIAGTIDLAGTIGGAAEKITGNFDLICPDLSGCEK